MRRSLCLLFALTISCGGGTDEAGKDAGADQLTDAAVDAAIDVPPEPADTMPSDTPVDTAPDVVETVEPGPRYYTFRAIGGVSMGANALTIHSHNPGKFDGVAALGGYINPVYIRTYLEKAAFAGFCDMETILAHLDEVNDPDSQALKCGPVPQLNDWEYETDFNHWHADDSGGDFDREFYLRAMEGIFMAVGNLTSYNPDNPFLPPGVPLSWAAPGSGKERCKEPVILGKPYNYNKEYNPNGEFDVITFCDGLGPIPVPEDHPDYWTLKGMYDPEAEHNVPVRIVVAVDYNGNGLRDYHEPIVVNSQERFHDWGTDGCFDVDEDGEGGCNGGGTGPDPNGDNHYIPTNGFGTEGDGMRQEGEPYEDFGLDGVEGTGDYGEGDGEWSINPNLAHAMEYYPQVWIDNAPMEELEAVDIFMDGGIRDSLHAATGTWPLAARLAARGVEVRFYDNYTGSPGAMIPTPEPKELTSVFGNVDWSAEAIGKNVMIHYGFPDATQEMIDAGDGKHVGSGTQIVNRVAAYIMAMIHRWPDMDYRECAFFGKTINATFHSPSMKNRFRFSYSLPPCYDQPEFEDTSYPLILFLPGHGLRADSSIAAAMVFNILMLDGQVPKFIFAVPEGQCCYVDHDDGQRYCTCRKHPDDDSLRNCIDPMCEGPEEDCDLIPIPKHRLEEECNGGSFFINHRTNRWGQIEPAEDMRYEDLINDLMVHLDSMLRLREPEVH